MKPSEIKIYPQTCHINGTKTHDETVVELSNHLYDHWICDRRMEPVELVKLLILGCERRGYDPGFTLTIPGP